MRKNCWRKPGERRGGRKRKGEWGMRKGMEVAMKGEFRCEVKKGRDGEGMNMS